MKSKKKLIVLFAFFSLNTSWAMKNEEDKKMKALDAHSIHQYNFGKIFNFLPPSDILSFMLTRKYEDQISKEAYEACSNQTLSITNTYIRAEVFSNMKKSYYRNLKKLDLSGSVFDFKMLSLLPETLIELSLDNISDQLGDHYRSVFIKHLLPALSKFKHLQKLSLKQNRINNKCISKIVKIAKSLNIKKLNLAENFIENKGASKISQMSQIEELDLSHNCIEDNGTHAISQMLEVKKLNLSGNKIGDNGALILSQMQKIIDLDLSCNRITDNGALSLSQTPNIKKLNLDHNKISLTTVLSLYQISQITLSLIGNPREYSI